MESPPKDVLAHDLRSLVGIAHALSVELRGHWVRSSSGTLEVLEDLENTTSFSLQALAVLERWSRKEPAKVSLGALLWGVRLYARNLAAEQLMGAVELEVSVPEALETLLLLVRSMSSTRLLSTSVEAGGVVRLSCVAAAENPEGVAQAIERLRALKLPVEQLPGIAVSLRLG